MSIEMNNLFEEFKFKSITVYEGEIADIKERESEFQGNISIYYILKLESVKIGPRISKESDFRGEHIKNANNIKARISARLYDDGNLFVGDVVKFNGKLDKDNALGYIVKNIRKIEKVSQAQAQIGTIQYYEEKRKEQERRNRILEQKVLTILQDFANKFPRIHLEELVKKIRLNQKEVIEILEKLIKNKKIPALFDKDSKGIEFHVIGEDIEKLFEAFDGWKEGNKKKSP